MRTSGTPATGVTGRNWARLAVAGAVLGGVAVLTAACGGSGGSTPSGGSSGGCGPTTTASSGQAGGLDIRYAGHGHPDRVQDRAVDQHLRAGHLHLRHQERGPGRPCPGDRRAGRERPEDRRPRIRARPPTSPSRSVRAPTTSSARCPATRRSAWTPRSPSPAAAPAVAAGVRLQPPLSRPRAAAAVDGDGY